MLVEHSGVNVRAGLPSLESIAGPCPLWAQPVGISQLQSKHSPPLLNNLQNFLAPHLAPTGQPPHVLQPQGTQPPDQLVCSWSLVLCSILSLAVR